MPVALDISHQMKALVPPREGDTIHTRIRRAARFVGVSFSTGRRLWYGQVKDPRASVIDKIRQAQSGRTKGIDHAANMEAAALSLEAIDPDFHREEIDRLRLTALHIRRALAGEG